MAAPYPEAVMLRRPLLALTASFAFAFACADDALTGQLPTLIVAVQGDGSVASSPAGIDCGTGCEATFPLNSAVTMTATPVEGGRFLGWAGACSGSSGCVVAMDANKQLVAQFAVALKVSVTGAGRVAADIGALSCPGTCEDLYAPGKSVTLTATPDAGQTFVGFGGACSGTGPCTLKLQHAAQVTASFAPAGGGGATQPLTVAVTGDGLVSSDPSGVTCPGTCSASFAEDTRVTLTAIASRGHVLQGWGGACAGTPGLVCQVTMDGAKSVTATFEPADTTPRYGLTVSVLGSGSVSSAPAGIACPGDCSEAFDGGTRVTLSATPGAGSQFSGWAGACAGSGATCTVTLSSDEMTSALFTAAPTDGTCGWANQVTGTNRHSVAGVAVQAATGNILLSMLTGPNSAFYGATGLSVTPSNANMVSLVVDRSGKPVAGISPKVVGDAAGRSGFLPGKVAWLPDGRYAVTGVFSGTADFGNGTTYNSSASGGGWRSYVAVYQTSGALSWAKALAEPFGYSPWVGLQLMDLAVDGSNNLFYASSFVAPETFGGSSSFGSGDRFVARYGSTGTLSWAKTMTSAGNTTVMGVAATSSGATSYVGSGLLGGYALNGASTLTTTQGSANGRSVAVLSNGDLLVTGDFSDPAALFSGASMTRAGNDDNAFVARFSSGGTALWVRTFAGGGRVHGDQIAYDAARDTVWVAGRFATSATFGSTTLTGRGDDDLFVLKMSGAGTVQSAYSYGGSGDDYANQIAVDASGNLLVAGDFRSSIDFGFGTPFSAQSFADGFIACLPR